MKPNVGSTDRLIRVIGGIVILSAVFFVEGNLRWLGLIGLVPLATALVGWCPAYALFGMDTCGVGGKKAA